MRTIIFATLLAIIYIVGILLLGFAFSSGNYGLAIAIGIVLALLMIAVVNVMFS